MNAQVFKKFIQEIVREAVRSELREVLAEHGAKQLSESLKTGVVGNNPLYQPRIAAPKVDMRGKLDEMFSSDIKKGPELKVENKNMFDEFLADSAQNMTAQEVQGLRNLD